MLTWSGQNSSGRDEKWPEIRFRSPPRVSNSTSKNKRVASNPTYLFTAGETALECRYIEQGNRGPERREAMEDRTRVPTYQPRDITMEVRAWTEFCKQNEGKMSATYGPSRTWKNKYGTWRDADWNVKKSRTEKRGNGSGNITNPFLRVSETIISLDNDCYLEESSMLHRSDGILQDMAFEWLLRSEVWKETQHCIVIMLAVEDTCILNHSRLAVKEGGGKSFLTRTCSGTERFLHKNV